VSPDANQGTIVRSLWRKKKETKGEGKNSHNMFGGSSKSVGLGKTRSIQDMKEGGNSLKEEKEESEEEG